MGESVWPVTFDVDASILALAPTDFTRSSPLRFFEPQRIVCPDGTETVRVVYAGQDRITHYAWPRDADLPPADIPLGDGIGLNQAADFRVARCHIGPNGVDIHVDFTDDDGHHIVFRLHRPGPRAGFDFAAPPAAGMSAPTSFFVPYLRRFHFVGHPLTFTGTYDGIPLRHGRLPLLINWRPGISQKAAEGTAVVTLLDKDANPVTSSDDGAMIDGRGHLVGVARRNAVADGVLRFDPPLPPSRQIHEPMVATWRLTMGEDRIAAGEVRLTPVEGGLRTEWRIERGWRGIRGRSLIAVASRPFRFLRTWPMHYSWDGTLTWEDTPALSGTWTNARVKS